jgi:hypothetical protein
MHVCLLFLVAALVWTTPIPALQKSEREHDFLIGPVSTITIETAKLSEKSSKVKEGRRRKERVITYDRTGNLIKEALYIDRPSTGQITYRYDADGNRTDSILIEDGRSDMRRGPGVYQDDERATRVVWRIFKCDSGGNRLEEELFSQGDGRRLVGVYEHTYDDEGNRQSTSYQSNGIAIYRQTFTYDDGRNATSMRKYSQDGSLVHEEKYTYELDSTGNWIKRISTRSLKNKSKFEAREVTYRKIIYF